MISADFPQAGHPEVYMYIYLLAAQQHGDLIPFPHFSFPHSPAARLRPVVGTPRGMASSLQRRSTFPSMT
jgi:hypothetical protein